MVGAGAEEIRCRGEDGEYVTLLGWMKNYTRLLMLLLCPRMLPGREEIFKH